MPTATLSHPNGSSVDLPLLSSGGDLLLGRDVGKPNQDVYEVGSEAPRTQDNQNATDQWTLASVLLGPNAYSDARTLAEDVIKPRLPAPLTLDLSDVPGRGTYSVVPSTESAATITYAPGRLDMVGVQLSLQLVSALNGGTQDASDPSAPPAGRGITLSRGAESVTLTVDNALTRSVGRPGIQLNPTPRDLPLAIDQNSPAVDTWELSGALLEDAMATAQTLEEDIIRPRLGNGSLTLSFAGGTYGLAEYPVVGVGSQALRTAQNAGRPGVVSVPTLELRTVLD